MNDASQGTQPASIPDGEDPPALTWGQSFSIGLALTVLVVIVLWPIRCRDDYEVVVPDPDSPGVQMSSDNVGCDSVLFTPLSYERNGSLDDLRLRLAGVALGGGVLALVVSAVLVRGASRWLAPVDTSDHADDQVDPEPEDQAAPGSPGG